MVQSILMPTRMINTVTKLTVLGDPHAPDQA